MVVTRESDKTVRVVKFLPEDTITVCNSLDAAIEVAQDHLCGGDPVTLHKTSTGMICCTTEDGDGRATIIQKPLHEQT